MSNHQFARDLEDANAERLEHVYSMGWPRPVRKLAQPSEPVATPTRWVTCRVHNAVHRERTTCVAPHDDSMHSPLTERVTLTGLGWLVATEGVVETR